METLKEVREYAERDHIVKVMDSVKWNKSKACKILDIDRKTLYNKIEKYKL